MTASYATKRASCRTAAPSDVAMPTTVFTDAPRGSASAAATGASKRWSTNNARTPASSSTYASSSATRCQFSGTYVHPPCAQACANSNHSHWLPAITATVSPVLSPVARSPLINLLTRVSSCAQVTVRASSTSAISVPHSAAKVDVNIAMSQPSSIAAR